MVRVNLSGWPSLATPSLGQRKKKQAPTVGRFLRTVAGGCLAPQHDHFNTFTVKCVGYAFEW